MGVFHGIADIDEAAQESSEFEPDEVWYEAGAAFCMEVIDGFFEAFTADEAHGVVGSAIGILSEAVNGNDAWVFEIAGDFGFEAKSCATFFGVGVAVLDFFEGDFAVEFMIFGEEDFTESTFGVEANGAIAFVGRGGRARREISWVGFGGEVLGRVREWGSGWFIVRMKRLFGERKGSIDQGLLRREALEVVIAVGVGS